MNLLKILRNSQKNKLPNGGLMVIYPGTKQQKHLKQIQELSSLGLSDDHLYFHGKHLGFCDGSKQSL